MELSVEYLPTTSLQPNPRNPRTHSRKQLQKIGSSMKAFDVLNPIMIDQHNVIIAGHARVAAAKLVGIDKLPCIRIEHLSAEQVRAYVIADNQLATMAGWELEILTEDFEGLIELGFDVSLTGFDVPEVDLLLQGRGPAKGELAEKLEPSTVSATPTARRGDIFRLGAHLLACGDATRAEDVGALMGDELAAMVFTDPHTTCRFRGTSAVRAASATASSSWLPER